MEKNQEVLNDFLQGWADEDYEKMFANSQLTWKDKKSVRNVQTLFSFVQLKGFKVISSTTISSVSRRFAVELSFQGGDKAVSVVTVACETAPYRTATYGSWGVNPISVMNVVQKMPAPKKPQQKPKTQKKVKKDASAN